MPAGDPCCTEGCVLYLRFAMLQCHLSLVFCHTLRVVMPRPLLAVPISHVDPTSSMISQTISLDPSGNLAARDRLASGIVSWGWHSRKCEGRVIAIATCRQHPSNPFWLRPKGVQGQPLAAVLQATVRDVEQPRRAVALKLEAGDLVDLAHERGEGQAVEARDEAEEARHEAEDDHKHRDHHGGLGTLAVLADGELGPHPASREQHHEDRGQQHGRDPEPDRAQVIIMIVIVVQTTS